MKPLIERLLHVCLVSLTLFVLWQGPPLVNASFYGTGGGASTSKTCTAAEALTANDAVCLSVNTHSALPDRFIGAGAIVSGKHFEANDSASLSITGNMTIEAWVRV